MQALTAHPTTKRENRSRITAKYSLPFSPITNSVVVARPALIWSLGDELLLQQIMGNGLIVIAVGGDLVALPDARHQALLLYEANDPLPADLLLPLGEIIGTRGVP